MKKWKSWNCHDCGAKEGKLHDLGCDMEECPNCGRQLISCGCFTYSLLIPDNLPFRIPYILIPNICRLCGKQWPDMFHVSDEEWSKYIIPSLQQKMLCFECYEELKKIFPDGWKK